MGLYGTTMQQVQDGGASPTATTRPASTSSNDKRRRPRPGMASVPPRARYASIEDSLKRMVLAQPPRFESIEATPSGDAD
jgi:hypothetical protein